MSILHFYNGCPKQKLMSRWECVTPHARHVHTHPSPCVPMFWHLSSHIYHLLHVTFTSWHSSSAPTIPSAFSLSMTCIMHPHNPTCATYWDVCHVCTHICTNWALPATHWILWVEIHCAVLSHPVSYHCPLKSNCISISILCILIC